MNWKSFTKGILFLATVEVIFFIWFYNSSWRYTHSADEPFNESDGLSYDNIAAKDVAHSLSDYLEAISLDHTNFPAYRGAILCYYLLGAKAQGDKLLNQAESGTFTPSQLDLLKSLQKGFEVK